MISIEIIRERSGTRTSEMKGFADHAVAAKWLSGDTCFWEAGVVEITWKRLACEHVWRAMNMLHNGSRPFECERCKVEFLVSHAELTQMYEASKKP